MAPLFGLMGGAGAVLARLQARPDLATIEGAVDGGYVHSLYVHDPDGNEVELYVDVPGFMVERVDP